MLYQRTTREIIANPSPYLKNNVDKGVVWVKRDDVRKLIEKYFLNKELNALRDALLRELGVN
jgi:hypothetical protein